MSPLNYIDTNTMQTLVCIGRDTVDISSVFKQTTPKQCGSILTPISDYTVQAFHHHHKATEQSSPKSYTLCASRGFPAATI